MSTGLVPFRVKVIRSGHIFEVYEYEVTQWRGVQPVGAGRRVGECLGTHRGVTVRRAKERVRRLINSNFGAHDKFVTFTFRDNVTDVAVANALWHRFVHRLRRRYPSLVYLAVIEFQKRGAVHYHMLARLPYVPKSLLTQLWANGFVKINDIRHVDNLGAYVTKYMVKDLQDGRLEGRRAYLSSRGLQEPVEVVGSQAEAVLASLGHINSVLSRSYTGEYTGTVHYAQYNLNRVIDVPGDVTSDVSGGGLGPV